MEPKYSVLYFKEDYSKYRNTIDLQLKNGIKVLWFGSMQEKSELEKNYPQYKQAFFLQAYSVQGLEEVECLTSDRIIDGEEIDDKKASLLAWIEERISSFNTAQYRVEHCKESTNIVVKASAGTGKTTVMIDRILYLMHMVPGLKMSEIFMITFTNEATDQMNKRLQERLMQKYSLTKSKRYLTWLEQQSQMHISTIDSLAYDLFKRFGTSVGFGRNLRIQGLEKERKDLIKDLLSENLNQTASIESQIGMSYPNASSLIDFFWKELTQKGFTIKEILEKDWGKVPDDSVISNFQRVLQNVLNDFEGKYQQLKLDYNAISINDLFFDFGHYLLEESLNCDGLGLKYLFVDEFQDTDATQVRTFANLVRAIGARLFAVGDIKQSIYAFKGATDEAFDILDEELQGNCRYYSLRNNYRTCANMMKVMEKYFNSWSDSGLLRYEEEVRAFNHDTGTIQMEYIENKDSIRRQTMDAINAALSDLELDIRSGRKKITDTTKVAVLVRGNNKAAEIAKLCRDNGKNVVLASDNPFYLSQAVRDFYAFISSFIFSEQPTYMFNYLLTPYASFDGVLSISEMEKFKGNELTEYLSKYVVQTKWHEYQREFRLRPVMAVIKDIVENESVIEKYISLDKVHMYGEEWTEAKKNKQALIDAKRYQKNLDRLMEILQQRMDGEFTTLYDIYIYLSLMIATNRDEMEPDVEMIGDYTCVYVMTVHKSKGLEYDTVIMPAMNGRLIPDTRTTIIADKSKVAWCYTKNDTRFMKSAWYDILRTEQMRKGAAEETRLLYVAMTRAVNKLVLLVNNWDTYESWSSLIRKVGLINES